MKRYLFAFCLLFVPPAAQAGVLTVSSPSVTEGAVTLEQGNGYEPGHNGGGYREHAFQFDYGLTGYWKSGAEFTAKREPDDKLRYALTEWKNTFSFFRQGDGMPVSLGLRAQYGFARDHDEADEIDLRLLIQHRHGPLDLLANFGLEHEVGANRASGIGGDFRGSARYWAFDGGRLAPAIDYLGKTGTFNDLEGFHPQDHRAGPVLYGKFDNGLGFDAGYLVGLSGNAPDHSLKLNLRYSF